MKLHPDYIADRLKYVFGEDIHASRIVEREQGVTRKVTQRVLHVTMARRVFHRALSLLKNEFGQPHISCPMASKEYDEGMELIYPFTLFSGEGEYNEIPVVITVFIPYKDLRIRTVSDVVPGILYMERETREMLGVMFEDTPDDRRLFTPSSLPRDMHPMRNGFIDPAIKNNAGKEGIK